MAYIKLIGIVIIVVGFALKLDVLAVVIVSGIVTGLVSGLDIIEILRILGESFVNNRLMSIFLIIFPTIAIIERYGLKERAAFLIGKIKNASAGKVLCIYSVIRSIASALNVRIGGHVQFVRPLILLISEAAKRLALTENEGEKINPAIESVKKLSDEIAGAKIIKLEIPTVCHQSLKVIDEAIKKHDPDVVLSIGQAGGRSDITVERIGINIDEPVFKDGPAAYFVNPPIKAMVSKIQEHQIPASVSNSAGTFVCNHVTYGVRHIIETKYPGKKSGFIHIPFLPQQVIDKKNMLSMSLEIIVEGLTAAIEAIVETREDLKITGGATH